MTKPRNVWRRFLCVDCGRDTGPCGLREYYSVHDAVWAAAGMAPTGGMLCLGCLECRLGRQLTNDDFVARRFYLPPCRERAR
jgi:hypothetical protein